ncbi:sigma-70 family RNA polymerase sigma factor [Geminicoccaceae bacterium 1502E]|nr:sigma-70 family RNA polymerase sigma factor [Geminicoccaceae bacterium 1502E]
MSASMSMVDEHGRDDLAADMRAVARSQDREAFRRLFDYYAPRLKAYLRRAGAAGDAAEDLAQEVMLTVWRRAWQFDPAKASLSTWVFTIARNKRIDALRRERRPDMQLDDPSLQPEPPPRGDNVTELFRMSQLVMRAVEDLPEEQSRLLKIFYFEEKPHGAIAEELGLPLGTVKSRLRLAMARLRTVLAKAEGAKAEGSAVE